MNEAEISLYFEPIHLPDYDNPGDVKFRRIGDCVHSYNDEDGFPDLGEIDLAIIGIPEDRKAINNSGCRLAPDEVRKYLYKLYQGTHTLKLADLGNIKQGKTVNDTYIAVANIVSELIKKGIIPILLGGSQDLTYANYLAYEKLGQIINIVAIDACFDLGTAESELDSRSYLSKIIMHQPNFLFNFANLGFQTYFVDQEAIDLMNKMYFDVNRLGLVRSNLQEVEPVVRNADILSFDIGSIRNSDAPGNGNSSPNGFYGEEACQIVRYAGLSDKLTSIGFYEINPSLDLSGQTAHLTAQMIWYFFDGYYNRKKDFPFTKVDDYIKYIVTNQQHQQELIFYKSKKSDRWWMKVPCSNQEEQRYQRHIMTPCSLADYEQACKNEIPDRWWNAFQKLM